MLLGPYPLPTFDTPIRPARGPSGILVRMRTRWRRNRLDAELSAGADPLANAELSERAAQLRSEPVRTRLANTLVDPLLARRLLRLGSRPSCASLERNLDELVPLIERLCDGRPIDVRGAAMTAHLVNDREGPLYQKGDLRRALRTARIALDAAAFLDAPT